MNQMYFLYIALFGLWWIDDVNGLFGYTPSMYRVRHMDFQMRAKRNKDIDDIWGGGGGGGGDIVAGLAAGGGGSANCRSISPVYSPRTMNQKTYVKYLGEPDTKIVLGVGAAGSGKTLFACYSAIQELRRGAISKIIMTRPVVPVEEEEIGFLPGSLINKMDPWTRPIFDILLEFYAQKDIDAMLHGGVIEISPLAFMRGRTFKRSFIIADEMQNSSPNQMLMLTTRLGEGSKMVITGDLKQSDRGIDNGLADLLRKLKTYDKREMGRTMESSSNTTSFIKYVELESEDVQRSAIVSKILDIYGGSSIVGKELVDSVSTVPHLSAKLSPMAPTSNINGEPKKTIVENKIVENGNNDAALMPLHHVSKYMQKY